MAQAIATHRESEIRCPHCFRSLGRVSLAPGDSTELACKRCNGKVTVGVDRAPDGKLILNSQYRAA